MAIRVTSHTLRCIDKAGGFDQYILTTKDAKLDSKLGLELKYVMRHASCGMRATLLNRPAANLIIDPPLIYCIRFDARLMQVLCIATAVGRNQ